MNDFKILIVEDDYSTALELELLLDGMGYNAIEKTDTGEKALELIKQESPDLVLMDIYLKGELTGIQTAGKIKYLKIPIIYLTASMQPEDFQKAKQTLPFAYLNKPFKNNDLRKSVELALAHYTIGKEIIGIETSGSAYALEDSFFVKTNNKIQKVKVKDILWVNSDGNYCLLNTTTRKFALKISLTRLKEKFPSQNFIQTHRSTLLRIDLIEKVDAGAGKVFIQGQTLPLGRKYKGTVLSRLNLL